MSQLKKVFYATEDVDAHLENIPKGQFSSRVNELILKGLSYEQQEQIKQDYLRYDEICAKENSLKSKKGASSTLLMSAKVFEAEDEVEDFV